MITHRAGVTDVRPFRGPEGVFGLRAGIDYDIHFGRSMMGWSISDEIPVHTRGSVAFTNRVRFNFTAAFRVGISLGESIHAMPHGAPDSQRLAQARS